MGEVLSTLMKFLESRRADETFMSRKGCVTVTPLANPDQSFYRKVNLSRVSNSNGLHPYS